MPVCEHNVEFPRGYRIAFAVRSYASGEVKDLLLDHYLIATARSDNVGDAGGLLAPQQPKLLIGATNVRESTGITERFGAFDVVRIEWRA
jgi:hypothetical protein